MRRFPPDLFPVSGWSDFAGPHVNLKPDEASGADVEAFFCPLHDGVRFNARGAAAGGWVSGGLWRFALVRHGCKHDFHSLGLCRLDDGMVFRGECRDEDVDFVPRQGAAEPFSSELGMVGKNDPQRGFFKHEGNLLRTFIGDVRETGFIHSISGGDARIALIIVKRTAQRRTFKISRPEVELSSGQDHLRAVAGGETHPQNAAQVGEIGDDAPFGEIKPQMFRRGTAVNHHGMAVPDIFDRFLRNGSFFFRVPFFPESIGNGRHSLFQEADAAMCPECKSRCGEFIEVPADRGFACMVTFFRLSG